MEAPVNKIIPFSLVDGPGSRVAIFLQGCKFNCKYCHNPETISMCSSCGRCVKECPAAALIMEDNKVVWIPKNCCECDTCIQVCTYNSSPKVRMMTPKQVIKEIEPALTFAQGITTSGGECTLHDEFLAQLFQLVHEKGKSAFVDTNGQRDFETMPNLVKHMDKAMLDIKSVDDEEHRMLTGESVSVVLKNLDYLLSTGKLFEIRTVVVPEMLDNKKTVDVASKMISQYPDVRYKLIKFRTWGVRDDMKQVLSPSDELMKELEEIARNNGVSDVVII